MNSRTFSSPSAAIFSGVSAAANNAGVALLTPASVACAHSTTAARSREGASWSRSVSGFGAPALGPPKRLLDLRRRPWCDRAGGGLAVGSHLLLRRLDSSGLALARFRKALTH